MDILDRLRREGWFVAVHNDYKIDGEFMTFWILVKNEIAVKGEARSDFEALRKIQFRIEQAGY